MAAVVGVVLIKLARLAVAAEGEVVITAALAPPINLVILVLQLMALAGAAQLVPVIQPVLLAVVVGGRLGPLCVPAQLPEALV